jgi:hypothetical protein
MEYQVKFYDEIFFVLEILEELLARQQSLKEHLMHKLSHLKHHCALK